MFRLVWAASIRIRYLLRWAPSNLLLARIRTRRGLKWGVPAMLLAGPLLLAAAACTTSIHAGGPGWLNLFVVLFVWDAVKFLLMGPVGLVLLVRVRMQENGRRHALTRDECANPTVRGQGDSVRSGR